MAYERNAIVDAFWKWHPRLYRWSGGRIGRNIQGMPVLLLNTVGRKSGRRRTNALTYLDQGDAYVVIASVVGEPRNPAWFHNLKANPETEVQVGSRRIAVRARQAEGAERDRLYSEMAAILPDYAEYADRTERVIPVMVLETR
jgi:deazaflavin-dependent oxidoreductase (nitroreductase family)